MAERPAFRAGVAELEAEHFGVSMETVLEYWGGAGGGPPTKRGALL